MPAIDLSLLPPVQFERISHTFTDPRCPGAAFTFEFGVYVADSESSALHLSDVARRLEETYVKGNKPLDLPGGGRVPIERTLCVIAAMFIQAENTLMTECAWSAEDWFRFSMQAPTAFSALQNWFMAEDGRIRGKSRIGTSDADDDEDPQKDAHRPND